MGERIYLNDNWKFTGEYSESLLEREFDDTGLETVRLPHTCKETPFHYFDESIYQMLSGYRKVFRASTEWKGKKILLTIDGAAHDSEVFLNGKKVGEHHCGYTAFTVDLSQHLLFGEENVLVVKVDSRENLNIPPFGFVIDYMTYGGIYREVYLEINESLYLSDVFVRSELQDFVKKKGRNRLASGKVVSEIFLNEAGEEYTLIQSIRKKGETEFKLLGEKKESQNRIQMQFPVNQITAS